MSHLSLACLNEKVVVIVLIKSRIYAAPVVKGLKLIQMGFPFFKGTPLDDISILTFSLV